LMLSWTWQYSVRTVVNTLVDWCESNGREPSEVFVWQCALCCNQYRIQERRARGEWEAFETFKSIFEKRVKSIGHVLAILAPWEDPSYVKRAWCILEFWMAATTPGVRLEAICASREKASMLNAIADGWLLEQKKTCLWFNVDIRKASTSSPEDKVNILRCIDPLATDFDSPSPHLDSLNRIVQARLTEWCMSVLMESLGPSSALCLQPKRHMMTSLCTVALLYQEESFEVFALCSRVIQDSMALAAAAGLTQTHEYASLAMISANVLFYSGDSINAHAKLLEVKSWKTLQPKELAPKGWDAFTTHFLDLAIAHVCVAQGRFKDAMAYIEELEPVLVAERKLDDSISTRVAFKQLCQVKAYVLHANGRSAEALKSMKLIQSYMQETCDTFGHCYRMVCFSAKVLSLTKSQEGRQVLSVLSTRSRVRCAQRVAQRLALKARKTKRLISL